MLPANIKNASEDGCVIYYLTPVPRAHCVAYVNNTIYYLTHRVVNPSNNKFTLVLRIAKNTAVRQ